jgi:hypothetical protein
MTMFVLPLLLIILIAPLLFVLVVYAAVNPPERVRARSAGCDDREEIHR